MFPGNLTAVERAGVILDQMDGLFRERGLVSTYGRASRSLGRLEVPLESPDGWKHLRRLGGVGPSTERILKEILDTGTSQVYEKVLVGKNISSPGD
jgi:DNA polymerase/3'-5' exonuclease PolX